MRAESTYTKLHKMCLWGLWNYSLQAAENTIIPILISQLKKLHRVGIYTASNLSYSDPLHAVSHCTPLQWINVTIAVEATSYDFDWKEFENCVLKMLKVFLKWCKKHRQKTGKTTFFTHQKLWSFPCNQFTMQEMQKIHLIIQF